MITFIQDIFQLRETPWLRRDKLDEIRIKYLKHQMHNINENVPYYKEYFRNKGLHPNDFNEISDLKKLPIITKEDILRNQNDFINKNLKSKYIFKSHTSGSTGQPFRSYFDRRCWIRKRYLTKLRARFSCGMRLREKLVIFEAEPFDKLTNRNKRNRELDSLMNVERFSIFENIDKSVDFLLENMPINIYGPPSLFLQMALYVERNKIYLPFLKRIFTSSEYLEYPVRNTIINAFKAEVFDVYGSTEFKEVAWECTYHQGYHINEDDVVCEIIKNGHSVVNGEVGDIVLTDLHNRVMPLIRYRIKDRGKILVRKCECNRTFSLIQPVAGRSSEYIRLPNNTKLSPYLFTTSIEKLEGLSQYQFVQTTKNDLQLNVILNNNKSHLTKKIESIVKDITKGLMRVSVNEVEHISVKENGKFMIVKNLISGQGQKK